MLISILGFLSYCLKVCNYTIGLSLIARDDDDDADFAGLLASAQCKNIWNTFPPLGWKSNGNFLTMGEKLPSLFLIARDDDDADFVGLLASAQCKNI